ncbi:hypothetical protein ACFSUM_02020 [Virgibacillus siamensis]|uniref:hypothetical protein n=1 Tax=Virgibacillus siamensis TaxID=480071 RepID=UPI00362DDD1D
MIKMKYILIALVILYVIFFLLPKRFPRDVTILFLIWGFAVSTLFDFTIGGGLIDLYKTNDLNGYELFDLLTYIMFAPISYLFIYIYDVLNINKKAFIWYILGVRSRVVFNSNGCYKTSKWLPIALLGCGISHCANRNSTLL